MVLLRHLLGDALRRLRLRQGRTLREVSASARVSLGYLSEVERGQKEASSELLAAICAALQTPLSHVLREVSDNFALAELQSEPVFTGALAPAIEVSLGHDGKPAPQEVPAGAMAGSPQRLAARQAAAPARAVAGARPQLAARPVVRKIPAPTSGPARLPLGHPPVAALGEAAFDRLPRTPLDLTDLTDMVPV